jgi:hypothetical protein
MAAAAAASDESKEFALQHPFTAIVVGPTGCGKTRLATEIVKNCTSTIHPKPDQIVWCYSELQPRLHEELIRQQDVTNTPLYFSQGLPDWNRVFPHRFEDNDYCNEDGTTRREMPNSLVVIDDFMTEAGASKNKNKNDKQSSDSGSDIVSLFTKGSHHRNLSVLFLCQNFFYKGGRNYMRDITLNTHYIFAFKNPRDRTQITHLVRQISPDNWRCVQSCYEHATHAPFRYLMFDLKQATDETMRYRTDFVWGAQHGCSVIYGPENLHECEAFLNHHDSNRGTATSGAPLALAAHH